MAASPQHVQSAELSHPRAEWLVSAPSPHHYRASQGLSRECPLSLVRGQGEKWVCSAHVTDALQPANLAKSLTPSFCDTPGTHQNCTQRRTLRPTFSQPTKPSLRATSSCLSEHTTFRLFHLNLLRIHFNLHSSGFPPICVLSHQVMSNSL